MTIRLEAWSDCVEPLDPDHAAAAAGSGLVRVQLEAPPDMWRFSAESRVGVVRGDGWEVRVEPRLAVPRLMFLLSYAADPRGWREIGPAYAPDEDLFTAVASAFAAHAERALAPAPLHGYTLVEERGAVLRGRLRVSEQIARWAGQPIPLEVEYDEFTADVPENRLVRGAADLLLRLPLLPLRVRRRLLRIQAVLEGVQAARPGPAVRAPDPTRLNERYRSVLALAELILQGTSLSTAAGKVTGISFVFDMNKVFEDFLETTLTARLERFGGVVRSQHTGRTLDAEGLISLRPDLTWWRSGACRAVIDAKYKALRDARFPNADAYQVLAYATGYGIERGYLVYARDDGQRERVHTISAAGKVIQVKAIDVERQPVEVLAQVDALAESIAAAA